MDASNQLSDAFGIVTIVKLAQDLGLELREGAGQKSPFRDDKKAGSFSVQKAYFKDHAFEEHSGGHIAFVELARPQWSKKECIEFIIKAAGLVPDQLTRGQVKREVKEKRQDLIKKNRRLAEELPKLDGVEPGPMCKVVRDRWNDGQMAFTNDSGLMAKLAESRGWEEAVLRKLVGLNKTSAPLLPWSDERGNKRSWAWMVEKPIFQGNRAELVPVGYHARYMVFSKDAPAEKRWCYTPYVPAAKKPDGSPKFLSDFQKHLVSLKMKLPAYPFVLGALVSPRLVVILEGQFDAVSFALAMGWLENGFPEGVCVFGLRGISSPSVFMAAYGAWLRRNKPFVWIIGDNDEAGKGIDRRKVDEINNLVREPSFVDRLRAQGCLVEAQFLEMEGCKDFNDIWKAHRPCADDVRKLAIVAGCGDLI